MLVVQWQELTRKLRLILYDKTAAILKGKNK